MTENIGSSSATSVEREREMLALRKSEGEAQEASVMVENMPEKDAEAVQILHLASTIYINLSNPTVQLFRAKRDTGITDLVNTSMKFFPDVRAQADSAPTGVLS